MGILFPESGFNYKSSFRWGVNDYAIAAICILAVILSDIIYHSSFVTHYKNVINDSELRQHWSVKMKISLFITYNICILHSSFFHNIFCKPDRIYVWCIWYQGNEENSTGHSSFAGTISGSYDFTELYSDSYHFDDL